MPKRDTCKKKSLNKISLAADLLKLQSKMFKCGRNDGMTEVQSDGHAENSIPPKTPFCRGGSITCKYSNDWITKNLAGCKQRTGAVVKPRALGREVPGSSPPVAVRCGLEQVTYPQLLR